MTTNILNKLKAIEEQHEIELLFAVESGSRAWGFASPDSDYDIRFLFKRKTEDYLSLWAKRDTIEFMTEDDLDGSGWDLSKATLLLAKSNASFLGWLFSPIVYLQNGDTLDRMKKLAEENFNPVAGFYHYHSMNRGFYEQLQSGKINIKAFFYATRTALCANWILKKESVAPVEFIKLYELIPAKEAALFDELIERKSRLGEQDQTPLPEDLVNLVHKIVAENERNRDKLPNRKANTKAFNKFFLESLK